MRSRPSGSSVSRCQIMAGASPLTSRIATARSRSQLEPGKTMTALFMGLCPSGGALDPEILDHGVGEELPAHRLDIVVADAFGQVELDQLRSEEHTSELQSLMRNQSAVF